MSLVSKLFNSNRSQYLLDIEESGAPEIKRAQRSGVIGSISKRIFGGVLVAAVGFSALAAGFMTYSAAAPQARADWISDIVCTPGLTSVPDESDLANLKWGAYAGYSNNMKQASVGALSPVGLEQLFSAATSRHYADSPGDYTAKNYDNTAYEVYGGFFPFFDAWYGAYDHDNKEPIYFLGTNGKAGTSTDPSNAHYKWATGTPMELKDTDATSDKSDSGLYSHNFLECGDLVKTGVVNLSNIVFFPAKVMVVVTNSVLGWALSLSNDDPGNPIVLIQHAISQLILGEPGANNGLKDQLYLTFLPPILMVATFGLLYQGVIKGRARNALGAGLWMLLATITGFLFVNNPMLIPGGMNNLVQTVTSALSGAIINTQAASASVQQVRANGKYQDATVADMCMVKGKNGDYAYAYTVADDGTVKQKHTSPQNYIRQTQCAIWKGMIYEPWVNGQFGIAETSSNAVLTRDPRHILSKTTVQLGNATYTGDASVKENDLNWPLYELVAQAQGEVTFTSANGASSTYPLGTNNISEVAFAQLSGVKAVKTEGGHQVVAARESGKWAVNGMWAGGNLDRQTGAAMLSFWGALVVTLYVMISAITIIGLQFSTLFLIAISPFFFLLGVAPGWGRRVLMRWFELIMEIVIKRIMIVFVLALYIKFFDIIVNLPLPYLFRLLALGIISFVALFQRNRITKIFTDQLKFGGNEKILDGSFSRKAKQGAKTAGVVAAAGGIAVLTAGAGTPIAAGMISSTGLVAGAGAASKAAGAKKAAQGAAGAAKGAAQGAAGGAQSAAQGAKAAAGSGASASATAQVNVQKKEKSNEDRLHDKKNLELTETALKERQEKASSPELDKKRKELEGVRGEIDSFTKKNPAPKGSDAYFAAIKEGKTEKDSSVVRDHKNARDAHGERVRPMRERERELIAEISRLEKERVGSGDPATDTEADELFGPVPVTNAPVAPSAGGAVAGPSREIPRGRLQAIPNTVDIDAANATAKRNARLKAAREAMTKAAASGKLNPATIMMAVDKGRDSREFAVAQQMGQINQQAAMVSANDAEERDIIRLEETVRSNDLAAQQQAAEQQRHIDRQQAVIEAAQAQAERDAAAVKAQDQIRRTTNRIDRKLNGPRDTKSSRPHDAKPTGPRDSGSGGGSGPRFPRKE